MNTFEQSLLILSESERIEIAEVCFLSCVYSKFEPKTFAKIKRVHANIERMSGTDWIYIREYALRFEKYRALIEEAERERDSRDYSGEFGFGGDWWKS